MQGVFGRQHRCCCNSSGDCRRFMSNNRHDSKRKSKHDRNNRCRAIGMIMLNLTKSKKAITAHTPIKIIARPTAAKPPNGRTIAPQTPPSSAVNAKVRKPAARSPSASPRACQPRSRPISRPIANATDNRQINASTLNSYIYANLLKAYRTRNLKMTHFQRLTQFVKALHDFHF